MKWIDENIIFFRKYVPYARPPHFRGSPCSVFRNAPLRVFCLGVKIDPQERTANLTAEASHCTGDTEAKIV